MDRKSFAWLIITRPFFLVTLIVFFFNEHNLGFSKPIYVQYYLNDFLAPTVLLTLTCLFLTLIYRDLFIFSKAQLLFFFLYLSFVFELLLPYLSSSFTADKYDLLVYAIGTILFQYLINLKLNEFKRDYRTSKKRKA